MTPKDQEQIYCSDLSLEVEEPLYGSAPQTRVYLLLEYPGAWGKKALEQSSLPEPVKARLNELGRQVKGLKTLFIKTQRDQPHNAGIRFFIAALSQRPPRLYAFWLTDYHDLLGLDVPAVLAEEVADNAHLYQMPLYLVCANGRRDRCCARHGVPVYKALTAVTASSPEPQVWQCTHVGGHRFAANLLCLPHGLLYGRVRPKSALAILEADRRGQLHLPNLRGRLSDPAVAQAAEYYLRKQHAVNDVDAYRLLDAQEFESGEWLVRFAAGSQDDIAQVKISVFSTEKRVYESCTLDKSTSILHYDFQLI